MNVTARRSAAVLTAVVLGSAALTACGPEDSAADTGAAKPTATVSHLPAAPSAPATTSAPAPTTAAPVRTGVTPAAKVKLPHIPVKPGCSNKRPTPDEVDPHTFAVYRYETIPGDSHINLVLEHGRWGCPSADADGLPYVTTGEQARWAMDQATYITATTPITDSPVSKRIGVQEFLDWVKAHPDSGLVFRYETGDDGAIHRLDEVYAP